MGTSLDALLLTATSGASAYKLLRGSSWRVAAWGGTVTSLDTSP